MPERVAATLSVYGALKRGQPNHALVCGQRYFGPAVTAPKYRLVNLGPYPGLVRDGPTGVAVSGESWAVSGRTLAELDEFETSADGYERAAVEVSGCDGGVDAYFLRVAGAGGGEDRDGLAVPARLAACRRPADYSPSTSSIEYCPAPLPVRNLAASSAPRA